MKKIFQQRFEKQKYQQPQIYQAKNNLEYCVYKEGVFEMRGKLAYHNPYSYKQFFGIVELQIEYSKNGTQTVIYDGQIIKKFTFILHIDYQPQNIENLEWLQFLNWDGNYGSNNQKIGKWVAYWKGEKLIAGGDYDGLENKIGAWVELDPNFSEFYCQVFHIGNYQNGIKQGIWQTTFNGQIIGHGLYNENQKKNGNWTELHNNFNNWNQITYSGVYKNEKKQGQWNTIFQREIIGGGQYDQNGLKNGQWTDIDDQICDIYNKLIYVGEYLNGIKKGHWLTILNGTIIGGGNFDIYGMKNGKWIDVINNFNQMNYVAEVGSYFNGIRIQQWDYVYRRQIIGGGTYNDEGLKNGEWIELNDNFNRYIDVQCKGAYQKGIKSGKWITTYKGEKIGEGQYNESGYKIGNWVELDQQFREYKQVIQVGEYKNGKKQGKWNIMRFGNIIGGGQYNEEGLKNGKWEDLDNSFCNIKQVTYVGEYINGIKSGKWETIRFKIIIGKGEYNSVGQKMGKWIDLEDDYYNSKQIIKSGIYQDGKKLGQWDIYYKGLIIGGGQYDQNSTKKGKWIQPIQNFFREILQEGIYTEGQKSGRWKTYQKNKSLGGGVYNQQGLKHGKWIDLDDDYQSFRQITYSGEYSNGKQFGKWYILYKEDIIGGGLFNENGLKDGKRIEIQDNFQRFCQITYAGEFQNGKKQGRWFILYQGNAFGGGHYNQMGLKNGEWIEEDDAFLDWDMKIHFTTYHQGIKSKQFLIPKL